MTPIRSEGEDSLSKLGALAIETFLSFEFVFLLFLVSGEFKHLPIFQPVNRLLPGERGDLTALLLGLNLMGAVYVLIKRGLAGRSVVEWSTGRLGYVAAVLAFVAYVLISYLVSPNNPTANAKLLEFSTVVIWCFLVALVISDRPHRVRRFVAAYCLAAVTIASTGVIRFILGGIDVQVLTGGFGGGYHRLGRMSGGTIVVAILLFTQYREGSSRTLFLLAALLAAGGLVVSGQRAPYVALPLTFSILAVTYCLQRRLPEESVSGWKFLAGMIGIGAILVLLLAQTERGAYVVSRLSRIGWTAEENVRLYMWTESLGRYVDNPVFGVGFGNFSAATGLEQWRQPHNFLVEMLLETGVVGLLLTSVVFFSWMVLIRSAHRISRLVLVMEGLVWYTLFNALMSGNVSDNRIFVVLTVMLTSLLTWNGDKPRLSQG